MTNVTFAIRPEYDMRPSPDKPLRVAFELTGTGGTKLGNMAGRSAVMQHLFARMRYTAPHFRLAAVEGEAGVGKTLAAHMLHRLGPAMQGPFAPWLAAEFLERAAEIWREARSGLLYLSGVDELTGDQQASLRSFLEHAAHERIRMQTAIGPLQVVAGSAQPLRKLAAAGAFRSDLAARLTAIRFPIPTLRERREDVPLLAELFLERWCARHGKTVRGFAPGALERLGAHPWPGNVRELENVVGVAATETTSQWIRPVDLPRLDWPAEDRREQGVPPAAIPVDDPNLDRAIQRHVARVLAMAHGNKLRAARLLGISRSTLYRMLETGTGSGQCGTAESTAAATALPG
jgi:two-component system response regulator AtoC